MKNPTHSTAQTQRKNVGRVSRILFDLPTVSLSENATREMLNAAGGSYADGYSATPELIECLIEAGFAQNEAAME